MTLDDRKVHLALVFVWLGLVVPTILWWRTSILWIAFMSLYAIIGTHWAAYEAAKAKDLAEKAEDDAGR